MAEMQTIEHAPALASPARLLEIAVSQDMGIDKLERLLALQERWDAQQAKKQYFEAFSKFQAECPEIPKNIKKQAGQKTLSYADLGQISKYIRPALENNGLSYRWSQEQSEGLIKVTCIMSHKNGHSETTSLFSNPDTSGGKGGLHSIMSTVTYLKRYTLSCVAGLSTVDSDDDGDLGNEITPIYQKNRNPITPYPNYKFNENLPMWVNLIKDQGRSIEDLQTMVESKGLTFTQEQIKKITMDLSKNN